MEQTRSMFCTWDLGVACCQSQHQCHIWRMNLILEAGPRCGLLSITTPVSHMANELDVQSELRVQVSLAAANQIL